MKWLLKPLPYLLFAVLPPVWFCVQMITTGNISEETTQKNLFYGGIATAGLEAFFFFYALILLIRKKYIGIKFTPLISLFIHSLLIFLFGKYILSHSYQFQNNSEDDAWISLMPFLIAPAVYNLIILASYFRYFKLLKKFWFNITAAFALPVLCYGIFSMILSINIRSENFSNIQMYYNIAILICVPLCLISLFGFFRMIFFKNFLRKKFSQAHYYTMHALFGILFPAAGLTMNASFGGAIFGDFPLIETISIALINGIILILPNSKNKFVLLAQFIILSAGFCYAVYFALIFLPYVPLGFIGILAMGAGLILLSPMVLWLMQLNKLKEQFRQLKIYFNKNILRITAIVSFLILPVIIITEMYSERGNIEKALCILNTPDYINGNEAPDISVLKNTLEKKFTRGIWGRKDANIPIVTFFRKKIVFRDKNFSYSSYGKLKKVFFNEDNFESQRNNEIVTNTNIALDTLKVESSWDQDKNCFISNIHFEILNKGNRNNSWQTDLKIPDGAFITNYYLDVNGIRKPGILAERKSAQWVFNSLKSASRDPGIVFLNSKNDVHMEVFPFAAGEKRFCGMQIMHTEPFKVTVEKFSAPCGNHVKVSGQNFNYPNNKYFEYLSTDYKKNLPIIRRPPYLCIVVDPDFLTQNNKSLYTEFITGQVRNLKTKYASVKILLGSWDSPELKQETELLTENQMKGFCAERVIRKEIVQNYYSEKNQYPQFAILTSDWKNFSLSENLSDISFAYPEQAPIQIYSHRGLEQKVTFENFIHLSEEPELGRPDTKDYFPVYTYQTKEGRNFYLRVDSNPSMILAREPADFVFTQQSGKTINTAMNIAALDMHASLNPATGEKLWKENLRTCFRSQILGQATSFIVVETKEQEERLKKKQEELLNGEKFDDPDEEFTSMSEPGIFILIGVVVLILIRKNRKKKAYF